MKLNQFLFYCEAEGVDSWVTTDTARLNASVNDFITYHYNGYDINDADVQDIILRKHNLSLNSIPDSYKTYLAQEVERKVW